MTIRVGEVGLNLVPSPEKARLCPFPRGGTERPSFSFHEHLFADPFGVAFFSHTHDDRHLFWSALRSLSLFTSLPSKNWLTHDLFFFLSRTPTGNVAPTPSAMCYTFSPKRALFPRSSNFSPVSPLEFVTNLPQKVLHSPSSSDPVSEKVFFFFPRGMRPMPSL